MKHDIPLLHDIEIYIIHVEIIFSSQNIRQLAKWDFWCFSNQRFNFPRINIRRLMNKIWALSDVTWTSTDLPCDNHHQRKRGDTPRPDLLALAYN